MVIDHMTEDPVVGEVEGRQRCLAEHLAQAVALRTAPD
jgi:hypothetical protein